MYSYSTILAIRDGAVGLTYRSKETIARVTSKLPAALSVPPRCHPDLCDAAEPPRTTFPRRAGGC